MRGSKVDGLEEVVLKTVAHGHKTIPDIHLKAEKLLNRRIHLSTISTTVRRLHSQSKITVNTNKIPFEYRLRGTK